MKRLLSLLLVIAMLFGVCAMFTACDSSSVSDKDDDDDKKKEDKEDEVEPTLVFKGLSIVLPEEYELDDKNEYGDNSGYVRFINDDYMVDIQCGPMEYELEGVDAEEYRDYYLDMMDPESDEVGEYDVGKKNGTPYLYAIKSDNTAVAVIAFYVDGEYGWMVGILFEGDAEDCNINKLVNMITGWKCEEPDPDEGEEPDGPYPVVTLPTEDTQIGTVPGTEEVAGDIIYDNMGIMILYTGSYDYPSCTCFELTIVNNSGYDVELKCGNILLNGVAYLDDEYTIYSMSGCTTKTSFSCYFDEMARLCVDYIGNIDFTVDILNCADYEYLLTGDSACIKTDMYGYEQPMDSYGVTLIEEAGMRVILQGFQFDGEESACMWLYIENNNDVPVSMDLERPTVNNWLFSAIYGSGYVLPHAYTVIPVDVYDLVEFGIYDEASIHSMEFAMTFYDASSYYGDEICTVNAYYYPGYTSIVQDMPADSIVLYDGYAFELRLFKIESYYSNAVVRLLMCNYRDDIPVTVRIENIVINGQPISDEFYEDMDVEARHLTDLWLYSNDEIGFSGVEDLQSLSFTLIVLDHTHYPIFEEVIEVPVY